MIYNGGRIYFLFIFWIRGSIVQSKNPPLFASKIDLTQLKVISSCKTAVHFDFEFCELFQITGDTPENHLIRHRWYLSNPSPFASVVILGPLVCSLLCTGVRGRKKQNPAEVDMGLFLLQPGQAWNPGGGGLFLLHPLAVEMYTCKKCDIFLFVTDLLGELSNAHPKVQLQVSALQVCVFFSYPLSQRFLLQSVLCTSPNLEPNLSRSCHIHWIPPLHLTCIWNIYILSRCMFTRSCSCWHKLCCYFFLFDKQQ